MYGGPVGFDGAERYQYPLDSEEGRAIDGLRKLRADGKAPDKLIVQVLDFAQPQFEKGFPQGAQSHLELFEEETGIKIEFVVTSPADEYPENLRNASTKNGSFDIVTSAIEEVGDFAEAGLLLPLDDFVAKYQPQWADPEWGYLGGEPTVALFNQYKGSTYTVAFDNDTQPWTYRADLMENADEMAAFADKYGRPLDVPGDVGAAGRGRRVLHAARRRHAALRRRLHARAVLVRGELEPAVRVARRTRT